MLDKPKLENTSNSTKKSRTFWVILFLLFFAIIQSPVIANLQLLLEKPELYPIWHFEIVGNIFLTFAASLFLIIKREDINTIEWWAGFAVMMIPFCHLKWIGVYYDFTAYKIAHAEGRTIGGGAAFGHLFLIVYIMGPAAGLSYVVFNEVRKWKQKLSRR